ncbi:MAG: hypothetical protein K0S26_3341 [Bacteroidota bacterium]|nr:hypothetical protein [Bacteroidota bacterium]
MSPLKSIFAYCSCLLFSGAVFVSCWDPEDHIAKKKQRASVSDSIPEIIENPRYGTKLLDTNINGFEIYIQKITDYVDVFIVCKDTSAFKLDSNTYHSFKFNFEQGKKKLGFPYKSILKKHYSFTHQFSSKDHWVSPDFTARHSVNWRASVPLCYFSALKHGKQQLGFDLEIITSRFEKKLQRQDSLRGPVYANTLISSKSHSVKIPVHVDLPLLYLRKLVVGETQMERRHDYDEGLYGEPDVFYSILWNNQSYFRSETADQCFNHCFKDTIYYFSEKLPKKLKVQFYDEDIFFDDKVGHFDMNFSHTDTLVRLKGNHYLEYCEYWISNDIKVN